MPNWCSNALHITGDREAIADFIKRVTLTPEQAKERGQSYDILDSLYPTPQELKETTSGFFGKNEDGTPKQEQIDLEAKQKRNLEKYGSKDWYDWNCSNWGTKWGDCDTFLSGGEGDKSIEFIFNTAWSPALEGIAHIATMFPTLRFACWYSEEGMGFYGFATFDSDGDIIDNCEQMEEIEGYADIDFEDDESYEKVSDLVNDARDKLMREAGW